MRSTAIFHLRALVCAGTHFVFSALLGASVWALTVADVLTTSSEGPPPWWLSGVHWLLSILNAPMAGFFGLWRDTPPAHLLILLMALAWILFLGYSISLVWQCADKIIATRHRNEASSTSGLSQ